MLVTDRGLHQALASRGYSLGADGEVDQARAAVELMSKRAALVEAAQARTEAAWRAAHPGEEPSRRVAHGWHHQAWEETRRPKPRAGRGPAELAERVRLELAEAGFDFTPGRYRGTGSWWPLPRWPRWTGTGWPDEVVAALSAARSAWSGAELTTAAERALAASGVVGDAQAVAELAEDLRARAEARCTSVLVGDVKVPSVMSRYLTSQAVVDADMALNLGLAGLAGDAGPRDTEAGLAGPGGGPGRRPGRRGGRYRRRGRPRGGHRPGRDGQDGHAGRRPGAPCGPRGGSWWCWPPPARRPRWPPRSWGPGHVGGQVALRPGLALGRPRPLCPPC